MFTADQTKALEAKLSPSAISQRQKAGTKLDYIEGWFAMSEANRIFGHDGWDRETAISPLGEPEMVGDKWRARFMAQVTIRVRAGETIITRQGVGFGSGIAKDVGDAYEGAVKEAETDATKRALATFGWPFGLALYDKERQHVGDDLPDLAPEYVEWAKGIISKVMTKEDCLLWWKDQREARQANGLTQDHVDELKDAMIARFPAEQKEAA